MTYSNCNAKCRKYGKDRKGYTRYQCRECKRTFTERHTSPLGGMYTDASKAEEILKFLIRGLLYQHNRAGEWRPPRNHSQNSRDYWREM